MDGFLRFLGLLFLIFLAYLILGFDKKKWKSKLRELKAEYNKANEEYVWRYKKNKKLESQAKRLSQLILFAVYGILFIPFLVICSYYNLNVTETLIAAFGTYMLFANPISLMLFGKDMGASALYAIIKNRLRKFLDKRYGFNSALIPVYLKKRDVLRGEILSVIKQIRK